MKEEKKRFIHCTENGSPVDCILGYSKFRKQIHYFHATKKIYLLSVLIPNTDHHFFERYLA